MLLISAKNKRWEQAYIAVIASVVLSGKVTGLVQSCPTLPIYSVRAMFLCPVFPFIRVFFWLSKLLDRFHRCLLFSRGAATRWHLGNTVCKDIVKTLTSQGL